MNGPTITGRIEVWSSANYSGLQLHGTKRGEDGLYPSGPVTLYAWSDGVVTWTEERHDLEARYYPTIYVSGLPEQAHLVIDDDVAQQLGKGQL